MCAVSVRIVRHQTSKSWTGEEHHSAQLSNNIPWSLCWRRGVSEKGDNDKLDLIDKSESPPQSSNPSVHLLHHCMGPSIHCSLCHLGPELFKAFVFIGMTSRKKNNKFQLQPLFYFLFTIWWCRSLCETSYERWLSVRLGQCAHFHNAKLLRSSVHQ